MHKIHYEFSKLSKSTKTNIVIASSNSYRSNANPTTINSSNKTYVCSSRKKAKPTKQIRLNNTNVHLVNALLFSVLLILIAKYNRI